MKSNEILDRIKINEGPLPGEIMNRAIEKRDELIPGLLEILDPGKDVNKLIKEDYWPYIYSLLLLARFQVKEAYRVIVEFCSRIESESLIHLEGEFGDFLNEYLSRVLASVSCGDIELIKNTIEDRSLNKDFRGSALDAFGELFVSGKVSRDDLIDYYKSLFEGKLEREYSSIWDELVCNCADLYPGELYDYIVSAFEEDLIDSACISMKCVKQDLADGKENTIKKTINLRKGLIEDVNRELEWFYEMFCFDCDGDYEDFYSSQEKEILERNFALGSEGKCEKTYSSVKADKMSFLKKGKKRKKNKMARK